MWYQKNCKTLSDFFYSFYELGIWCENWSTRQKNFKKVNDECRNSKSQPVPELWTVKLKISFLSTSQTRISFKAGKIFNNWCHKRTQRSKLSPQTEFQADWKVFIFWSNFSVAKIFGFRPYKSILLKWVLICFKIGPFPNEAPEQKCGVKKLQDASCFF